jgi:hypothetical protein
MHRKPGGNFDLAAKLPCGEGRLPLFTAERRRQSNDDFGDSVLFDQLRDPSRRFMTGEDH